MNLKEEIPIIAEITNSQKFHEISEAVKLSIPDDKYKELLSNL